MSREMKESGIGWVGKVPTEWNIIRGKYVLENHKDVVGSRVEDYERLALTLNGVIKRSKEDNEGLQPDKFDTYQILRENELVFKLIDLQNLSTSRVGLSPYNGIVSPAYIIITPKDEINSKFAEYYYLMMWMRAIFNQLGDAGVRSSLNANELLELSLPLPSLHEQHRIVNFLDSKCSQIDEISKKIQEEIDTLEEYKKSVITEAVTKGLDPDVEMKDSGYEWLGMIPTHWILQKGKYLFVQKNEKGNNISLQLLSPTQNYGVIPQSLYEELSGFNAVKLNDKTDFNQLKTVHKGAYVISLRSFQGGFEYSEYEGVVSPAYQVFYPVVNIDDRYYKYFFKTQVFIEKMNSYTMSLRDGKNIAFVDFGNTYIPYPPKAEQRQIADYLDEKTSQINASIDAKKHQLEVIEEYKKSLIYEYVTGKKEVV